MRTPYIKNPSLDQDLNRGPADCEPQLLPIRRRLYKSIFQKSLCFGVQLEVKLHTG
jgi:hypothetical protein